MSRPILTYTNNVGNNHTINWAGFDPTATGDGANYLHVSTGDGAFNNNYNGGAVGGGRPSQNPESSRGKILRMDISAGATDVYPGDNNNNFGVPASNPIPVYNAANRGDAVVRRSEAWVTGMRNAYRISFDRQNGDLYMGDVGENLYEEISFLKAGTNTGSAERAGGFRLAAGGSRSRQRGPRHRTTRPTRSPAQCRLIRSRNTTTPWAAR